MVEQQYDRRRIESFGRKVAPLVREYLVENGPGALMGVPTAGRVFAVELYRRLLTPGPTDPYIDVIYLEAERGNIAGVFQQGGDRLRGRHLIVVDDDIHTKKTYEDITTELEGLREEHGIKSINWAVEFDGPGVATWACNRINNGNKARA